LIASFAAWYNVVGKEASSRSFEFLVEFVPSKDGSYVIAEPRLDRIRVMVSATPTVLDFINNMTKKPLQINMQAHDTSAGLHTLNLEPKDLPKALDLPGGAKVDSYSPDPIPYHIISVVDKIIPIVPELSGDFDQRFEALGDIVVKPAEVTVRGPTNILDGIQTFSVKVDRGDIKSPETTLKKSLDLSSYGSSLEVYDKEVEVSADVRWRLERMSAVIPIVVSNAGVIPRGRELELSASQIEVAVLWPANQTFDPENSGIRASITLDPNELGKTGGYLAEVNLVFPYPECELVGRKPSVRVSLAPEPVVEEFRPIEPPTAQERSGLGL
jgi:hypothetical protein